MSQVLKIAPQQAHAAQLTETIQKLVAMLATGECVGFLAVGIRRDGGTHLFQCGPDVPLISSIGAVEILRANLIGKIEMV